MTNEDFEDIIWGDHPDFESVTEEQITEQSRWSTYYQQVFKQKSTGKFFQAYWGRGSTEMQDGQEEDWSMIEVEPFQRTITDYKAVKNGVTSKGVI